MKWVTAARPGIDRCASAWLIRRFVDPKATFSFVAAEKEPPGRGTPFDMPGAKYGHEDDQCTFETILRLHKLTKDVALKEVASLVHDLDFHKQRHRWSSAAQAYLRGLLLIESDDQRVLRQSATFFDALYAYLTAQAAEA